MRVINSWVIYGANGYTGKEIAREAVRRGHEPIIAGRNESQLKLLAEELEVEYRVFSLNNSNDIKKGLDGIGLVLNCAGPFSATADALRAACIDSGVNYLDITGEIPVLEASYASHEEAKQQGCVVMSGVGFDVVPTDFLANQLKKALPDATHLEVAFAGEGGLSPGTAKTMVEMMGGRCKILENGEQKEVPLAYKQKDISFDDCSRWCMTIPWGDIATAYYSTGIPNIAVFTAVEKSQAAWVRRFDKVVGLVKIGFIKRLLNRVIEKKVFGPDNETMESGFMQLWGQVSNGLERVTMTMQTPEGYRFTVLSSLLVVEAVLAHKFMPGAYTPAQALDEHMVLGMDGVQLSKADREKINE